MAEVFLVDSKKIFQGVMMKSFDKPGRKPTTHHLKIGHAPTAIYALRIGASVYCLDGEPIAMKLWTLFYHRPRTIQSQAFPICATNQSFIEVRMLFIKSRGSVIDLLLRVHRSHMP